MFACSNIQTRTKPNFVCVIIGAYHEGPSVNASDQISLILNAFNSYFADAHPHAQTSTRHATRGVQGPHSIPWIPEEPKGPRGQVRAAQEMHKHQATSWCGKPKDSQGNVSL